MKRASKLLLASAILLLNLSFVIVPAKAAPIPIGCPGSTNPATPPPADCAEIPIGCPGSTLVGPPSAPFDPADCPFDPPPGAEPPAPVVPVAPSPPAPSPTGVDTDKIQNPDRDHNENCSGGQDCLEDNELVIIAKVVVNLLSALVGIVVTIVIVLAGIQYASSGGNPQAVASARKSIVNGVIALVAFGLLWTGLQWLIPGGLF